MIKFYLEKLMQRSDLKASEAYQAFEELESDPDPVDMAAFLILLKIKGEQWEEIGGIVKFFQERMIKVNPSLKTMDIVGTGGDNMGTVNISTGSSLLASACGIPIAKHGNRSISSRCGAADLVEAFGVKLELPPRILESSLKEVGIAFLYAPYFHPAIKTFSHVRKKLGFRTVFNLVGTLLNPARSPFRMIGVFEEEMLEKLAKAISTLEVEKALVFQGLKVDELSTLGPSKALLVSGGKIKSLYLDPADYGFKTASISDLQGGDALLNRELLIKAFEGKGGAISDTLAFNAGVALWLYGIAKTISEGVEISKTALKQGLAIGKLNEWIQFGQTYESVTGRHSQSKRRGSQTASI